MANVLAPPWPTSRTSGVFSQHGLSQSSGGNPNGGDLKMEEEDDDEFGGVGDGNSSTGNKVAACPRNDNHTQESFTQQTLQSMTQMTQNNELTQLGGDDDDMCDDYDDNDESLSQDCCHSPISPIDPLTLPWGRLMPVGAGGGGHNDDGGRCGGNHLDGRVDDRGDHYHPTVRPSSSSSQQHQQQQRGPTEMLPRYPANSRGGGGGGTGVATRSRSPSLGGTTIAESSSSSSSPASRAQFLGLKNLLPGDRFNEYVIGRSVKVRIIFFHRGASGRE
jgi:hypothetical protein